MLYYVGKAFTVVRVDSGSPHEYPREVTSVGCSLATTPKHAFWVEPTSTGSYRLAWFSFANNQMSVILGDVACYRSLATDANYLYGVNAHAIWRMSLSAFD